MNPGLWMLARAGPVGMVRRIKRRMTTVRGALTTLFAALFLLALVGTQLAPMVFRDGPAPAHDSAANGFVLILLVFTASTVVMSDAPFFWPREVQYLFPAPLPRHELLLYLLISRGWLQVISGVWIGVIGMKSAPLPWAALPAAILSILFLNVVSLLAAQIRVAVAPRLPAPVRRAVKPALVAAAALGAYLVYGRVREAGPVAAITGVLDSAPLRAALFPLRPLAEAFAAETALGVLAWCAASIALIVVTGALAFAVPADFREESLSSSARKADRFRRRNLAQAGLAAGTMRRVPVPALRFLGTAAPLARRQVYELGRGLRPLVGVALYGGLALFYVIMFSGAGMDPEYEPEPMGAGLVALAVVFPLLASNALNVDFRRDVARMAYLRSLPLSPSRVAVGQVFTGAAILALANVLLLAGAAWWNYWFVDPAMALLAGAVALPVAWLSLAVENWLALLFPTQLTPAGTDQNAFAGKALLKVLIKTILLGLVGIVVGMGAWLGHAAAGAPGAAAGALTVAVAACVGATLLVGNAFRGFDLATDSPE